MSGIAVDGARGEEGKVHCRVRDARVSMGMFAWQWALYGRRVQVLGAGHHTMNSGQGHWMSLPPHSTTRDTSITHQPTLTPPVRFLELVRPFMSILPEVTAPEKKVRLSSLRFIPLKTNSRPLTRPGHIQH